MFISEAVDKAVVSNILEASSHVLKDLKIAI
jgi:hypothetical protein